MDKEDIRALEPKYTGNTRHLTEGEAAAIAHDPANRTGEDGMPETAERLLPLGLTAINRNS
jgi:hypothetical protein